MHPIRVHLFFAIPKFRNQIPQKKSAGFIGHLSINR